MHLRITVALAACGIVALGVLAACAPQQNDGSASEDASTESTQVAFTWSYDSTCTQCHEKEATSMDDTACLAATHAAEGTTCATCHTDENGLASAHENATPDEAKKRDQAAQHHYRRRGMPFVPWQLRGARNEDRRPHPAHRQRGNYREPTCHARERRSRRYRLRQLSHHAFRRALHRDCSRILRFVPSCRCLFLSYLSRLASVCWVGGERFERGVPVFGTNLQVGEFGSDCGRFRPGVSCFTPIVNAKQRRIVPLPVILCQNFDSRVHDGEACGPRVDGPHAFGAYATIKVPESPSMASAAFSRLVMMALPSG